RPWKLTALPMSCPLIDSDDERQIIKQIQQSGIARIIFLTPAIWNQGVLPGSWNVQTGELEFKDIRVKLLTYAVGRPLIIGGWDIQKQRPKKRMPAIPAGSVYYVEVQPAQAEQFVRTIHSQNWSDHLAHEGYGYAICGAYHG